MATTFTTQKANSIPSGAAPAAPAAPSAPSSMPQVVVNIPGPVDRKNDVSDILHGAAAVLWPLVVALALILFQKEIIALARRMKKGSAFGAEAEFGGNELQTLNQEANKA